MLNAFHVSNKILVEKFEIFYPIDVLSISFFLNIFSLNNFQ